MSDEYRNALAVGTLLDTYRIERVLGEGGFGVTYLVTELNLGNQYAIKELIPDGVAIRQGGTTVMARSRSMEEDFAATRRHFIKEARVLDALKHPAIVAVHRLFEANGTCYMVMDYVEGETLGAHLKKQGGMLGSREEFEGIFYPIMDGLEVLHGKEMIHRDIKPGNIMVSPNGSPVLLDFGASCRVENHTVTMTQMLSAGYSPFEQYTTRAKQGPYTDIYALGATMVRAITGAKPDDAADRMEEDFYQSLTEQEELVIEYGEQLLLAIDAALLLKKTERPQSIEEWRELIGEEDSEEDPEAQYNLGVMYANGEGVEKDEEEAVKWYRLAADQGHAKAQFNLGVRYVNGEGVEKDDEEAVKWYRKAADQDFAEAQYNLGVMYANGRGVTKDDEEAVKWYRKAADQDFAEAQYNLGIMFANARGVTKDDDEAVKWLRKSANQGDAIAQYKLGVKYESGKGLEKDDEEALRWYRRAADQGNAEAQYELGLRYESGEGVSEDYEKALDLYRKAAEQGHEGSKTLTNEFRLFALFSWEGRLGVKGFWISQLVMLLFFVGLSLVAWVNDPAINYTEKIFILFFMVFMFSLPSFVRRLHDLGKSGVSVIPMFVGGIYLTALLHPQGGLEGDNLVVESIFIICFLFSIFNYGRLLFSKKSPK